MSGDAAFATAVASDSGMVAAPDGSMVDVLMSGSSGSMARFVLAAGSTSRAVVHRTVEELWFVLSGRGEMWRRRGGREEIVTLASGTAVSIPVGTVFQFRSLGADPLVVVGVTMPPWPGEGEATVAGGPWPPTA